MATVMSRSRFLNSNEKPSISTLSEDSKENNSSETMKQPSKIHFENDIDTAAKQFYANRKITVKNFNTEISLSQVYQILNQYGVTLTDFDEDLRIATVKIKDSESVLDVMRKLLNSFDVTVEPSKKLLCIANLHADFTDIVLKQHMLPLGNLVKCFMFRCPHTGGCLGYGFVEFDCSIERTKQIQTELDWSKLENLPVHCDFVDITSFDKLCSRCLLIDNIPKDFTDVMKLRDIFSCLFSPLYCQIVTKNGESLGFGIVEYKTHEEAQRSKIKLEGHVIKDQPIRISYCMPGKSGIYMCSRILSKFDNESGMTSKKGLLPDPVFMKDDIMNKPFVKQLCEQHPDLMPCFKQALNQLQQIYMSQVTGSAKPGLLGPAPSVAMNPLLNPNMQIGLLMLLAKQIQPNSQNKLLGPLELLGLAVNTHTNKPSGSILGNPVAVQASNILKNLTSQISMIQPLISNPLANRNTSNSNQQNSSFLQSMAMNLKNLNMNMLINLGQLASSLQTPPGINGNIQPKMNQSDCPNAGLLPGGPQPSTGNSSNSKENMTYKKPKSLLDMDFSHLQNGHDSYERLGSVKENIPYNRCNVPQQRGGHRHPVSNQGQRPIITPGPLAKEHRNSQTFNPVQNRLTNHNLEQNDINSQRLLTSTIHSVPKHSYQNTHQTDNFSCRKTDPQKSFRNHPYRTESHGIYTSNDKKGDGLMPPPYLTESHGIYTNDEKGDGLMPPPRYSGFIPPPRENSAINNINVNRKHSNFIDQTMRKNIPKELSALPPPLTFSGSALRYQEESLSQPQSGSHGNPQIMYREEPKLQPQSSFNGNQQILYRDPLQTRLQTNYVSTDGVVCSSTESGLLEDPIGSRSSSFNSADLPFNKEFLQPRSQTSSFSSTELPLNEIGSRSQTSSFGCTEFSFPKEFLRSRSQTSSVSDFSDSFSDQPSSFRSNDSLFSDGGYFTDNFSNVSDTRVMKTPIGRKRSCSQFLPPPEPSPEGDFIGQHSQGLGGHYAISYRKRPKMDGEDLTRRY